MLHGISVDDLKDIDKRVSRTNLENKRYNS